MKTYAEKLAEFVKATGSKPGEMNRPKVLPPKQQVVTKPPVDDRR